MLKRLLVLANSDSSIFKFRQELLLDLSEDFQIGLGIPFGQYIDEISNSNYELFDIPVDRHGMNPIEDFRLLRRYRALIRSFHPDVVLEYTIKPNLYGSIVCGRKIPCLCNITGLGTALEKPGTMQKMMIAMYRFAMMNVDTIFFQNTAGEVFFREHKIGRTEQYIRLPGSGVNLKRFEYIDYPTTGPQRFLFVARIIKEKGIDEFLSVANRFHDEGLEAEFHICGACEEDGYHHKLESLHDLGIVKYHGLVKDMRSMYAQASCVVLPSYYPEGQSNVLLEGAASGRPLITTDHPGCREAVKEGITGFLVNTQDADDLYDKVKKMYELSCEDRRLMGLKGRSYMENTFDRKIVVRIYRERLSKLGLI